MLTSQIATTSLTVAEHHQQFDIMTCSVMVSKTAEQLAGKVLTKQMSVKHVSL